MLLRHNIVDQIGKDPRQHEIHNGSGEFDHGAVQNTGTVWSEISQDVFHGVDTDAFSSESFPFRKALPDPTRGSGFHAPPSGKMPVPENGRNKMRLIINRAA